MKYVLHMNVGVSRFPRNLALPTATCRVAKKKEKEREIC